MTEGMILAAFDCGFQKLKQDMTGAKQRKGKKLFLVCKRMEFRELRRKRAESFHPFLMNFN